MQTAALHIAGSRHCLYACEERARTFFVTAPVHAPVGPGLWGASSAPVQVKLQLIQGPVHSLGGVALDVAGRAVGAVALRRCLSTRQPIPLSQEPFTKVIFLLTFNI